MVVLLRLRQSCGNMISKARDGVLPNTGGWSSDADPDPGGSRLDQVRDQVVCGARIFHTSKVEHKQNKGNHINVL